MTFKDFYEVVIALALLALFTAIVSAMIGAGLNVLGVLVPVKEWLIAGVYFGFSWMAVVAFSAYIWKTVNKNES